ncbi:GNAT family N-acetyltransferase [Sporomusa sp.]|uniref:GNAT family N-acetyltransferase n=1 Tax=Sporomusa sp. TaxID=2078658 RepID=UPI002C68C659|nr:GNAT family N-acetyltransferase [Sporomusa sp.]HWR07437.1 GNAT family N-acetyltransferase [Sporomusa sp.]
MEVQRVTTQCQLDEALRIRVAVFVTEQGVPQEAEIDEHEALAEHILVYNEDKLPVGTGRFRIIDGIAKLERICVLAAYRQYGLGRQIVGKLEEIAKEQGLTKVKLHGQTHAEHFYNKLGYKRMSDVFIEEGIPHILMTKDLI